MSIPCRKESKQGEVGLYPQQWCLPATPVGEDIRPQLRWIAILLAERGGQVRWGESQNNGICTVQDETNSAEAGSLHLQQDIIIPRLPTFWYTFGNRRSEVLQQILKPVLTCRLITLHHIFCPKWTLMTEFEKKAAVVERKLFSVSVFKLNMHKVEL